jgi:putative flippase GtrA
MYSLDKLNRYKEILFRFMRFSAVGAMNTAIDIGIFVLLTGSGIHYLLSHCISYSVGMVNSYLLNKMWTFRRKGGAEWKEMLKFLSVNLFTLGFAALTLFLLREGVGLSALASKVMATCLTLLINFGGNALWVFKSSKLWRREAQRL